MDVRFTCFECKKEFFLERKTANKRERLKRKHSFCSQKCVHTYQSHLFSKQAEPKIKKYKEKHPDGMKTCRKCETLKPLKDFGATSEKIQSYCKKCLTKVQGLRLNYNKIKGIKFLGGKCSHCGLDFHPAIYDFHHTGLLVKEFEWSRLRRKTWSSIVKELEKCILLCANCHRLHHTNPEMWIF